MTDEEKRTIDACRSMAQQTISDIAREWTPNQMLGWNGVWFMYQAAMIPLVSMFWESGNRELVRSCQAQIEMVLETFDGLADWSLAARRSREVVSKMYEASKRPLTRVPSRHPSPRLGPVTNNAFMMGNDGMMCNGFVNGNGNGNGHPMDLNNPESHPVEMVGEEGFTLLDQGVWDLDGMLWGNLPDGLDMPYDELPMLDYDDGVVGFDPGYLMHQ